MPDVNDRTYQSSSPSVSCSDAASEGNRADRKNTSVVLMGRDRSPIKSIQANKLGLNEKKSSTKRRIDFSPTRRPALHKNKNDKNKHNLVNRSMDRRNGGGRLIADFNTISGMPRKSF